MPQTSAPPKTELGKLIREIRGNRTLREFAADLGVSYQSPFHWEQGIHDPGPESFYALYREATPAQRKRLEKLLAGNGRS